MATTSSLSYFIHRLLIRPVLRAVFGIHIEGQERFQGLNQYIMVANHNSHLDILILFSILPTRDISRTSVVAASDYFSRSRILFGLVNFLFSPVWVDRTSTTTDSMQGLRECVTAGNNLILFPEGSRGKPGEIGRFHVGVAKLAEEFQTLPVVPVFLSGPERALPKNSYIPLPIWNNVHIGPVQSFRGTRTRFARSLEEHIREFAAADRAAHLREPGRPEPSKIVAVMGIDGSGKSTMSRLLAIELSCHGLSSLISDELEIFEKGTKRPLQPLVTEYVRDAISRRAKRAKSLKHYKLPKLVELLLRDHLLGEVERWYRPSFIVQDGSPLLNLVGWAILYKQQAFNPEVCSTALHLLGGRETRFSADDPIFNDFPELIGLLRFKFTRMNLPHAVLMLDVPPQRCFERILQRGARIQPHENVENLMQMREGYLKVCAVVREEMGIPVHVLGGDLALEDAKRSAIAFVSQTFS